MKTILLASALCMSLPLAAMAQGMNISQQDKMFVKKAGGAGLAEVADGELARQQGDKAVKKVAERMVSDHQTANEQLASLAEKLGVQVPAAPDSKDQMQHDQLAQLSGSQFDAEYLRDQLTAHQKAIAVFQKEADQGDDPQLKQFASDTLPVLQMHLQMIQKAMAK